MRPALWLATEQCTHAHAMFRSLFNLRTGVADFLCHGSRLAESFPNTTGEEILAAEFLLCQGIRFAFDVRHPYRALEGAVMELKQLEDVEVRLRRSALRSL